jgi:hypothetical protein
MNSRFITNWKIPNISNLNGKFEYVFFTKDEKTNRTGNPQFEALSHDINKILGSPNYINDEALINTENGVLRKSYSIKNPRFIELKFNQPILTNPDKKNFNTPEKIKFIVNNINNLNNSSQYLNTEENVTAKKDIVVKNQDYNIADRLSGKLKLLKKLNGFENEDPTKAILKLNLNNSDTCINLIGQSSYDGLKSINENNELYEKTIFLEASKFSYDILFNAEKAKEIFYSFEEKTNFLKISKLKLKKAIELASADLEKESNPVNDKPVINSIDFEETNIINSESAYGAKIQGYLIYKRETLSSGLKLSPTVEYLDAESFNNETVKYLDSKIVYGSTYEYSIRTVLLIRTLYLSEDNTSLENGKSYLTYFLAVSNESESVFIKAEENEPPNEPDGIFYNFMYYKKSGLRLRWQLPTNKQNDIKYFQIFRRKNINEPFTCIAELDFDDSEIKSLKTELVQINKIYKYSKPVLQFVDKHFTRDSSYIYAIAAIDAHGMSSGYSVQTKVTFNKFSNQIETDLISKKGAPKQYPNFYINPNLSEKTNTNSLTQDAILLSNAKGFKIYYTPDAKTYISENNTIGNIVNTEENLTEYKFHFINLDRQKDQIFKIKLQ